MEKNINLCLTSRWRALRCFCLFVNAFLESILISGGVSECIVLYNNNNNKKKEICLSLYGTNDLLNRIYRIYSLLDLVNAFLRLISFSGGLSDCKGKRSESEDYTNAHLSFCYFYFLDS